MKMIFIFLIFSQFTLAGDCTRLTNPLPEKLSETCLYKDILHGVINPSIASFEPNFALYTDGMDKKRWMYLPKGGQIENTDNNNWVFPVGTILWKEFSNQGLKLETRLLYKVANSNNHKDWVVATYMWRADQTGADAITKGADNVHGTIHQIPSLGTCMPCHHGSNDMVLGFSAFQLSQNKKQNEMNLADLLEEKMLTSASPKKINIYTKNELEKKAIGYLHANCAHCHGPNHHMGRQIGMMLNYDVNLESRDDLPILKTAVDQPTRYFRRVAKRIEIQDPEQSALYLRLHSDQAGIMMAPIGRKTIDEQGSDIVRQWINNL